MTAQEVCMNDLFLPVQGSIDKYLNNEWQYLNFNDAMEAYTSLGKLMGPAGSSSVTQCATEVVMQADYRVDGMYHSITNGISQPYLLTTSKQKEVLRLVYPTPILDLALLTFGSKNILALQCKIILQQAEPLRFLPFDTIRIKVSKIADDDFWKSIDTLDSIF